MNRDETVKDMAKILCPKGTANCEKCSKSYKCDVKFSQLAKLVEAGCRKVAEDEIVMSKKAYYEAPYAAQESGQQMGYAQGRDEMAREILRTIRKVYGDKGGLVLWLTSTYGIELE